MTKVKWDKNKGYGKLGLRIRWKGLRDKPKWTLGYGGNGLSERWKGKRDKG